MGHISSYYHHELVRYSINPIDNIIQIKLQVPIKPQNQEIQIAEIFTLPFYHTNPEGLSQICQVDYSSEFTIIVNQVPVPISLANNGHCALNKGICQYFGHSTTATTNAGCIQALFKNKGAMYQHLHEACPFTCRITDKNETSVISLGWFNNLYQFAISQPPPSTKIICKNSTSEQIFDLTNLHQPIGIILVEIQCGCFIQMNGHYPNIVPAFPCVKGSDKQFMSPRVNIAIPSRWGHLNFTKTMAHQANTQLLQDEGFKTLKEIYNHTWYQGDIVVNLTKLEKKSYETFFRALR